MKGILFMFMLRNKSEFLLDRASWDSGATFQ